MRSTARTETPAPRAGGYCQTPNSFFLELQNKVSGHAQAVAIGFILHATLGGGGTSARPEWAKISLRQFAARSRYDVKTFENALRDAVDRGLIAAERDGRGMKYKALPENWATVPDYEYVPPPAAAPEPDTEPDTEPDNEPDAEPDDSATSAAPERMVLLPGKARAVPLRFLVRGIAEPVKVNFECTNDSGMPLCIRRETIGNRFRVIVSQSSPDGEETANHCRSPLRQSKNGFVATKEVSGVGSTNTKHTSNQSGFASFLASFFRRHRKQLKKNIDFSSADGKTYARDFMAKLSGAPLAEFSKIAEPRFRKGDGPHSPGLVLRLASETASSWRADLQAQDSANTQARASKWGDSDGVSLPEVERMLAAGGELEAEARRKYEALVLMLEAKT